MKDSKSKLSWAMKANPKTLTVRGVGATFLRIAAPVENAVVMFTLDRKDPGRSARHIRCVVNARLFAAAYRAFPAPPAVSAETGDDPRLVFEADGITRFVPILSDEPIPDDPEAVHTPTDRWQWLFSPILWVGAVVTTDRNRPGLRNVTIDADGMISANDSFRAHRVTGTGMPSMVIPGAVIPLLHKAGESLQWVRLDGRTLFSIGDTGTIVFPAVGLESATVVDGDRMSSLPLVSFTVDADVFRRALKGAGRKTLVDVQVDGETMRIAVQADVGAGVPAQIISQTGCPISDLDTSNVPDEQIGRFTRLRSAFVTDALSDMDGPVRVTIPKTGPVKLVNGDRCAFIMGIRTSQ